MTDSQTITRIIGVGSHHGVDQLGWLLCDQLNAMDWPQPVDIQACRVPAQLPELLHHCDKVILVDAILTHPPAGQVITLSMQNLKHNSCFLHSSHGLGVTEALELARVLKQLPTTLKILGITVTDTTQDPRAISQTALPVLQQVILEFINTSTHKIQMHESVSTY